MSEIAELINADRHDEAGKALDSVVETDENRCDLLFLRGYLKKRNYDQEGALTDFNAVLEQNPDHTDATFQAALIYDLGGNDEKAVELYERCVRTEPTHVNPLLNLAVLYEQDGLVAEAEQCLRNILAEHPYHPKALRQLKSVEVANTLVYDEHSQREREQRDAILDTPITDFELSVRSRNCLRQVNIRTLGDLLRVGEAELLSYKNFGETSLAEIRAMLTQKGLRLGQGLQLQSQPEQAAAPSADVDPATVSALSKPVSELELSVRSRKCLQRLGIATVAELASRTEPELMTIKNFGQTSLTEIKRELALNGLSLRQPS